MSAPAKKRYVGRAVYVCTIGCPTECEHGEPCEVGSLGHEEHPAEHRFTGDFDRERIHYWRDGQPCRFVNWERPA